MAGPMVVITMVCVGSIAALEVMEILKENDMNEQTILWSFMIIFQTRSVRTAVMVLW